MKALIRFLIVLGIVIAVLVFARNIVVKAAVEGGATMATGMPLSIKKLDIDLAHTLVDIEGLVLKNPAGFHDTVLVNIPKILVDYNLTDILKGKIHLENVEFDLEQLSVVRNEKKELNLDSLKSLQKAKSEKAPAEQPAPEKKGELPPFQIDNLRLKVGKASFIDYSGGEPSVKEFNVGLDESYKDITDPNKLVALIVVKVMMKTPLAMLSGFNVGDLQGSVAGVLGSATDMAGKAADQAAAALKNTTETASELAGQTSEQAKETAGAVTSSVKSTASKLASKLNPF